MKKVFKKVKNDFKHKKTKVLNKFPINELKKIRYNYICNISLSQQFDDKNKLKIYYSLEIQLFVDGISSPYYFKKLNKYCSYLY